MKIWSDRLGHVDIHAAANEVNADFPGCSVYVHGDMTLYRPPPRRRREGNGPRTRRFDGVSLRANNGTHYVNPGNGVHIRDGYAASWTEWGWFLARVFAKDPNARAGEYRGVDDFHAKTHNRFREPRTPRELQIMRTTPTRRSA